MISYHEVKRGYSDPDNPQRKGVGGKVGVLGKRQEKRENSPQAKEPRREERRNEFLAGRSKRKKLLCFGVGINHSSELSGLTGIHGG